MTDRETKGDAAMALLRRAAGDGFVVCDTPTERKLAERLAMTRLLRQHAEGSARYDITTRGRDRLAEDGFSVPVTKGKYQLLPPLSAEDFAALEADIRANGVRVPVEYDEDGNILDGHHRVVICERLGIGEWPRFVRKGLTEDDKRAFARSLNLSRRHLSTAQKRQVIEAQLRDSPSTSSRAIAARLGVDHKTVSAARGRLIGAGEIPQSDYVIGLNDVAKPARRPIRTQFLPERENFRELKAVAKAIRSHEMQTSRQVRLGVISAIAARGSAEAGELPRAAYPVLYADPPWQQEAWSNETGQDKGLRYPSMPLDAIKALCAAERSPATPDAILYLWVTNNRLADGIDVLRSWGFAYKTAITWDKQRIGMGRLVRDRTEHLLIATRGAFPGPVMGTQPESLHSEARGEHSVKPAYFAETIERLYPDLPKLELFCRSPRPGWTAWGFEAGAKEAAE